MPNPTTRREKKDVTQMVYDYPMMAWDKIIMRGYRCLELIPSNEKVLVTFKVERMPKRKS